MGLNKDNLEKWVGALESGKWEQIYCDYAAPVVTSEGDITLGLCAVGVGIAVMLEASGREITALDIEKNISSLSSWTGISTNPRLEVDGHMTSVMALNDTVREPFSQIAQLIRKQYL